MFFTRVAASVAITAALSTALAGCGGSDDVPIAEQSCRQLAGTLIALQRQAADRPANPPDIRDEVKQDVRRVDELGGCPTEPVLGH